MQSVGTILPPRDQWVHFLQAAMLSRKTTAINVADVSLAIEDCEINHTLVKTTTDTRPPVYITCQNMNDSSCKIRWNNLTHLGIAVWSEKYSTVFIAMCTGVVCIT